MQQQMGQFDEEQLYATERERNRALAELRAMKKMVEDDTNAKQKMEEMHRELNSVKALLANANEEMNNKEKMIKSLKLELETAKGLEMKLKEELANVKSSEARTMALSTESAERVLEMEVEVEKGKESGTKMFDSLVSQMKKLEETQMRLEESKVEIASLNQKVKTLESLTGQNGRQPNGHVGKVMESLRSELNVAKDNLADAEEVGKQACLKTKSLIDELDSLKNELKLAIVAEENSQKALEDLALALKEVVTEASKVKAELGLANAELEHSRGEEDRLNLILKSSEERYKQHLEEALKEAEKYKNTAERLRLEAEETLLAWNDKETGLVDCIRKADEERSNAQQEISRLADLLNEAENKTRLSKEENSKLRDILKQALSESNVAKEAMLIAKAENSELKDRLAEKEESLIFFTRENENYKLNEAAAIENINELKRLLYEASEECKKGEKEKTSSKEGKVGKIKIGKTWSFHLKDLKLLNKNDDEEESENVECEIDQALRGSIFDVVDSPVDTETDVNHHRKKSSSAFSNEDESVIQLEDFDNLDGTHFDDLENDRTSRKKKALLRRFGDLLIRKRSLHKKEPSE
ncbi:putative WEB family protein At1g65010, chloroplastic [Humulus lupulus]|uniref:putative WEB family protein At1g65010, chloroplastic n=1 Tax=Humulus lupulus TaxID=3486 RepID=UPI002B417C1F|nr:putative WEB family protein At1g65010, chloroplastic [Humulus lupulus]XP_062099957.1 putative WEB family protein At1g65010, chloroplastic [Humulus lupulus]